MKKIFILSILVCCCPKQEKKDKNLVTITYNKKDLDNAKIQMQNSFPIKESDIVLLGDSKTEGFPTQEIFNNLNIKNRGIAGNTTADVLHRLQNIVSGKPRKIFLEIGLNDLSENNAPEKVFLNFSKICSQIKKASPNTIIYVQSVLPTTFENKGLNPKIFSYNKLLQKFCSDNKIQYIDLNYHFLLNKELNPKYTIDGTHLNIEGYFLWKDLLKPYLNY
ncbi:multifunctional acyl-CoA thioesterase I and protease I and lysophospholipase L1 [Chryseobacterium oranimense G311]|uniref:GDSL-type esterase/lipase family protein n=1 Tax=Chryseobacterium oranimense TaxID=421058 RepID=UPI000533884C|nr:GDSL-type esterase/lipase family protein [Chryseobacterium oranimense]CEJ71249.1 multifunctional acyl-CoA thioesterase I and protease I and lysophospholipase L1 [Chryseobacterium oranimense G311]